jgi:hypothetical protein
MKTMWYYALGISGRQNKNFLFLIKLTDKFAQNNDSNHLFNDMQYFNNKIR